jgi:hypothetical protein
MVEKNQGRMKNHVSVAITDEGLCPAQANTAG